MQLINNNVKTSDNALGKMLDLRGVNFEWKEPAKHANLTGIQMGMIAQEAEKVFPDWVSTGKDGYKVLGIRGFEGLTVESLRELKRQKDQLETEVQTLKKENVSMKESIEELKAEMAEVKKTLGK